MVGSDNMTFNATVFQRFGRVILKLLRGLVGPLGGLLGTSWRPLGGLLGVCWGSFGASGGRFDVKHHFETLEISGRAVLKPSWGRVSGFPSQFWSNF